MTRHVLITGAAGFIGSALARGLAARGWGRVVGLDTVLPPQSAAAPGVSESALFPGLILRCDIREREQVARIVEAEAPDTIVHVAGRTGMRGSVKDPAGYYATNVRGTENVLAAAGRLRCHVVLISSGSIYGDVSEPVEETFPLPPPSNPYIETKRLAEDAALQNADRRGCPTTILRVFTVYGPHQRAEMAIRTFVSKIWAGQPVTVYGEGNARRDFLHVDDCVEGILRAVEKPPALSEIVNLATGISTSLTDLLAVIGRSLERPVRVENVPTPDGIPVSLIASIQKARALYGYSARISLGDGIPDFINWYRQACAGGAGGHAM
ncbi:MAG: NAD-dependent epimerase/dehydratase family protein [Acidobacteria bacterium]|nr:NAD-dependent epimerase/dehydratase family protein [Acidobacteriota bacterium]